MKNTINSSVRNDLLMRDLYTQTIINRLTLDSIVKILINKGIISQEEIQILSDRVKNTDDIQSMLRIVNSLSKNIEEFQNNSSSNTAN